MKEMKTQLILFSLLLLGSTAWAQQPCLSQDAYREKVEAYSQILKQQKLKTLA
ncbi:TolC family protein, partial [Bacteroides thetaiotaomicron]